MKKFSQHIIAAFILLALIGISFAYAPAVHAADPPGTGSVIASVSTRVFAEIFNFLFQVAATFTSKLTQWLNIAINFNANVDVPVVRSTWKIVRDFTNMFFIIIMIVMAFSMIFKVPWLEGYEPGRLMVQFVAAALLINFSLVICGLIIDGSQSINSIFITAIGDFGDRLGQQLNPSQWLGANATKDTGTITLQLLFTSIILFIVDFSLIVALAFTLIRVPFLWLLAIISPLALLGSVLPSTRKAYQTWWQQFIGWNFFLPIFLAVLYLGMIFLNQQNEVMQSIVTLNVQGAGSTTLEDAKTGFNIGIQTIFFYFLVAMTLIGGTNAAIKGSLVAGVGAVAGAQWAKNWALRQTGVGAFQKAGKERWEQIQKEGYGRIPGTQMKIFGGPARGTKLAERAFGIPGAAVRQQRDFVDAVNKEMSRLKDEETAGQLKIDQEFIDATKGFGATTPEGAARRSILYERGMIDSAEFAKDIDAWTKSNPFLAEAMIDKAKKGKFKKVKGAQLLEMAAGEGDYTELGKRAGANVARRKLFEAIGENDDALKKMTAPQLQQAVDLMGGKDSNDTNEYLKTVGEKRPDIVAEYRGILKGRNIRDPRILGGLIYKEIASKQPKDLAEMLDTTWARPEFSAALIQKYKVLQIKSRPSTGGVQIPGLPVGLTFVPPGNPTPAGAPAPFARVSGGDIYPPGTLAFFPGVRGAKELAPVQPATATNDAIYDDDKNTNRALANIPRARRVKENPGGGEIFKTGLERAVSNSPIKLAVARSIRP